MNAAVVTTSREKRPLPDGTPDAEVARLRQENTELRQTVDSHATVAQAIGFLIATRRIRPAAGFEVLREVSQRTNVKLHRVAEAAIAGAGPAAAGAGGPGTGCGGAAAHASPGRPGPAGQGFTR
jgi:hypothetical protein